MADKITRFEDYKKKDKSQDTDFDIQIEDPYNFFNEQEREEYFKERQKEAKEAARNLDTPEEDTVDENVKEKEASKEKNTEENIKEEIEEKRIREKRIREKNIKEKKAKEKIENEEPVADEEYDDEYDDDQYDDDEEDDDDGKFPIEKFIRISSIITGVMLLAVIIMLLKVKVFDRYFVKDPDEVQTVEVALPSGYTAKNDTVVVTAKQLNLRSVDNSESKATIVTSVPEGTQLKRVAVNEAGTWALVEYNGSQVYASMKYLGEVSQ